MGGEQETYQDGGANLRPFASYVDPIEQTARYCGMNWEEPFVVFGALSIPEPELARHASALRARLEAYALAHGWRVPAEAEGVAS